MSHTTLETLREQYQVAYDEWRATDILIAWTEHNGRRNTFQADWELGSSVAGISVNADPDSHASGATIFIAHDPSIRTLPQVEFHLVIPDEVETAARRYVIARDFNEFDPGKADMLWRLRSGGLQ